MFSSFLPKAYAADSSAAASPNNAAPEQEKPRPQPLKYQEVMKETYQVLHLDTFEGFKMDLTKPLNNNFAMMHSLYMGNESIPPSVTGAPQALKVSHGQYEIGAICFKDGAYFLRGKIGTQGSLQGTARLEIAPAVGAMLQFQMTPDELAGAMLDIEGKGADWNGQLKVGNGPYYGANYMQSVTKGLSLGGEIFCLKPPQQGRYISGLGFAARYQGDRWAAAAQATSTRLVSAMYARRFYSDKLTLATELMSNFNTGVHTATAGYDYNFRNARVRGTINSNWVITGVLEEKLNPGFSMVLSAELDHKKGDYRFGYGLTLEPNA